MKSENSFFLSYYSLISVVGVAVLISWFGFNVGGIFAPEDALAITTTTVTVSASVATSISCSTDNGSTAFGPLDSTTITTSSLAASTTMSCANSSAGCTLIVKDTGGTSTQSNPGLWNATSSALIESPNATFDATATLAAGTEGFGIRATTTSVGSGGALSIVTRYNTGLAGGLLGSVNDVGGLSTSTITLASSTSASTAKEIVVVHKAAVAATTPGGTYDDTITYGCTAN